MMMDDPILLNATLAALILIPLGSYFLSKTKPKWVYLLPIVGMMISFPMFLLVVIAQGASFSRVLFYISMSLWTGSFFGLLISYIMARYHKKK